LINFEPEYRSKFIETWPPPKPDPLTFVMILLPANVAFSAPTYLGSEPNTETDSAKFTQKVNIILAQENTQLPATYNTKFSAITPSSFFLLPFCNIFVGAKHSGSKALILTNKLSAGMLRPYTH
jgi:hypothetical protein